MGRDIQAISMIFPPIWKKIWSLLISKIWFKKIKERNEITDWNWRKDLALDFGFEILNKFDQLQGLFWNDGEYVEMKYILFFDLEL